MKHNWGTLDSVLQSRVLAALSIMDVRGVVKKRSWPGQWRRDQIAFSCPRHQPPLVPRAGSPYLNFLPFLGMPPLLWGGRLWVQLSLRGTDLFPKASQGQLPAPVCLSFLSGKRGGNDFQVTVLRPRVSGRLDIN